MTQTEPHRPARQGSQKHQIRHPESRQKQCRSGFIVSGHSALSPQAQNKPPADFYSKLNHEAVITLPIVSFVVPFLVLSTYKVASVLPTHTASESYPTSRPASPRWTLNPMLQTRRQQTPKCYSLHTINFQTPGPKPNLASTGQLFPHTRQGLNGPCPAHPNPQTLRSSPGLGLGFRV